MNICVFVNIFHLHLQYFPARDTLTEKFLKRWGFYMDTNHEENNLFDTDEVVQQPAEATEETEILEESAPVAPDFGDEDISEYEQDLFIEDDQDED